MADNKRDIELRIAATTSGADAIKKLGDNLEALAKEGGQSAGKFKELGDELSRLGNQGDALSALNAVASQVAETSDKFAAAKASAQALGDELAQQRNRTEDYRNAQTALRDGMRRTEATLLENTTALRKLRAEYVGSAKDTVEYRDRNQKLRLAIIELQDKLAQQKAAFKSAREATSEQSAALNEIEQQYGKAERAVVKLETTLGKQNAALNAAESALKGLGLEASGVDDALAKVEAALKDNAVAAGQAEAAYKQMQSIESAVAAANERNGALARKAASDRVAAAKQATQAANEQAAAEAKIGYAAQEAAGKVQAIIDKSREAGKTIDNAFGVLGVRSATAIRDEINAVGASLIKLTNNSKISGEDFDRAFAQAQTRIKSLNAELAKTPGHIDETGKGTQFLTSGLKQLAAAYVGIDLVSKFVDANVQIETLRRSLTLVTGSTDEAARQIGLLRSVANNAGVSIGDISASFVKFQASLNGAKIPLDTTEGLFRAITNAAGQLGLSGDKVGLMLDALAQTANKGVVSMEELRQQLGDSLPGALDLTAKGLGISTSELVKLTESGQLLAADFLPALRKALVETFGDGEKAINGLGASIARFKNTLTTISQAVGDSGVGKALSAVFDGAATGAKSLTFLIETVALDVEAMGLKIGTVAAAIVNGDLRKIPSLIAEINDAREAKLVKLVGTLEGIGEAGKRASAGVTTSAEANAAAGAAAQASTAGVNAAAGAHTAAAGAAQNNAGATNAAAGAATTNAGAQEASAKATTAAGQAATGASNSWVQLTVAYQKEIEAITNDIAVSDKLVAAKRVEGEARLAIAKIAGDGVAVLRASADAADAESTALNVEADNRLRLVQTLEREKAELQALIVLTGDAGGQRTKQLADLEKTIALKTAEAEKTLQMSNAAEVEANSRALAVKATQDNSAALLEMKAAYDLAGRSLAIVQEAQRLGLATDNQVVEAKKRVAAAEYLYNDAIKDTTRNLQLRVGQIQSDYNMTKASIDVKMASAKADEQAATAIGNERMAIEAKIAQKRIEIEGIRAAKNEKIAESNATIQKLESDKAEIRGMDDISVAKRKEIDLRIQNERAKIKEAGASDQVVRGLNAEIDALQRRNQGGLSGIGSGGIGPTQVANGDTVRGGKTYNSSGQEVGAITGTYDIGAINALRQKQAAGTLSAGDLRLAEVAYETALANSTTLSKANSAFVSSAAYADARKTLNDSQAILGAVRSMANPVAPVGGSNGFGKPAGTSAAGASTGGTVSTVNINFGGRTTSINTAAQADAAALTALLQQLGDAANRAGP